MGTQKDPKALQERVTLRCVGGPQDGQRFMVPRGRRSFPFRVSKYATATYRLATIASYDGDFSFLTPKDWTDADALRHLFGELSQ